jgi:hypothetical protein
VASRGQRTGEGRTLMPARTPEARAIASLLRARGIRKHALFLTAREGTLLPNGLESVSGFALDASGRVHAFWLDWDAEAGATILAPCYAVERPEDAFAEDAEYHAARRSLGLA